VATLLWLAGLVATACVLPARRMDDYGTTTEIAMLSTFLLGVMAVGGRTREAMALAALVAWILGAKLELKHRLQRHELLATLQLLLIAG